MHNGNSIKDNFFPCIKQEDVIVLSVHQYVAADFINVVFWKSILLIISMLCEKWASAFDYNQGSFQVHFLISPDWGEEEEDKEVVLLKKNAVFCIPYRYL